MFESAAMYEMEIPTPAEQLSAATLELLRRNDLVDTYIRPIAYFDAYSLSVWPRGCPVSVAISRDAAQGGYLGAGASEGVRVCISSVRRFDASAIPTTGKACGQYLNSVRARCRTRCAAASTRRFFLNQRGEVAEGSGENLFLVKDGGLTTNDEEAGVLMGITRASVIELAGTLGIPVRVAPITVDDMRGADELFFTGTAVEVTPIKELDGDPVAGGLRGPVTTRLQQAFLDIVKGRDPRYRHWLAYVT